MRDNYYKLLGIDELTSKPLTKIAYLMAIENEKIEIKNLQRKKTLEIKYIIRTLFTGIWGFLIYLISETLGDLLTLTMDIRSFLASLLFYFSILNLFMNWIDLFYSLIIILTSIGLVFWHLKSFERQVKKNCG